MRGVPADPWALRPSHFPGGGALLDKLRFLVRYAVLAPSGRNAQPWHFEVAGSRIKLYADRSRHQRWTDPYQRDLYISLGCALENLLLGASHFGFRTEVAYFPLCEDDELVAQVRFADGHARPAARPSPLFAAMTERRTHHGHYDAKPCGAGILRKLMECCNEDGLALLLTEDTQVKQAVDRLVRAADSSAMARAGYRSELAEAVGAGGLGAAGLGARLGKLAVTHFGKAVALRNQSALSSSPAFGLISASRPGRKAQVLAGRILERLYLTAATLGVCLQPLSVLLNHDEAATALGHLFRGRGSPLLAFRFGRASRPARPTPRRVLEEVLHDFWMPID